MCLHAHARPRIYAVFRSPPPKKSSPCARHASQAAELDEREAKLQAASGELEAGQQEIHARELEVKRAEDVAARRARALEVRQAFDSWRAYVCRIVVLRDAAFNPHNFTMCVLTPSPTRSGA